MDISVLEVVVESPCINVCELGEDNICCGCFRSLDEIASWGFASNQDRKNIVACAMDRKLATSALSTR
jgi:predicted Fe-S protein YdhL (DUF1289 family)